MMVFPLNLQGGTPDVQENPPGWVLGLPITASPSHTATPHNKVSCQQNCVFVMCQWEHGAGKLEPPQSLALGSLNSPPFCLQRVESAVSYAGNPVPLLVFLSLLGHVRKSF